eukprot:CAMPEP_0204324308 /NCGR_PEP_ID=MMETSP0469-20131031/10118_1 /ASSEMBLY_ACC=CAM_ASM_000384 /TAXON_ID=2969 /ORGANISM="Oxyrrhis marina" /LENGTH=87 /DNA_ID=CAMNT_0051305939 /DNA_START=90 /DNA_END=349 /DNA_ORIENTATION=-
MLLHTLGSPNWTPAKRKTDQPAGAQQTTALVSITESRTVDPTPTSLKRYCTRLCATQAKTKQAPHSPGFHQTASPAWQSQRGSWAYG